MITERAHRFLYVLRRKFGWRPKVSIYVDTVDGRAVEITRHVKCIKYRTPEISLTLGPACNQQERQDT